VLTLNSAEIDISSVAASLLVLEEDSADEIQTATACTALVTTVPFLLIDESAHPGASPEVELSLDVFLIRRDASDGITVDQPSHENSETEFDEVVLAGSRSITLKVVEGRSEPSEPGFGLIRFTIPSQDFRAAMANSQRLEIRFVKHPHGGTPRHVLTFPLNKCDVRTLRAFAELL
jgi:hypothetical protein